MGGWKVEGSPNIDALMNHLEESGRKSHKVSELLF
jgi:hypothetical protein